MGRAELRRKNKQNEKRKTATYNLTRAQLDDWVMREVENCVAELKREATDEAVNTAMVLLFTLPMEVLMDHFWQDSYGEEIPKFTEYVLEYYRKWQDGELDMDKMKEDLWVYGGVRLEESEG